MSVESFYLNFLYDGDIHDDKYRVNNFKESIVDIPLSLDRTPGVIVVL